MNTTKFSFGNFTNCSSESHKLSNLSSLSKDGFSNSDINAVDYFKKISSINLEVQKEYKKYLVNKFIKECTKNLTFDNSTSLPLKITERCENNILKGELGFFMKNKEKKDKTFLNYLFSHPASLEHDLLSNNESNILRNKLFESISKKCMVVEDSISEVNGLDCTKFIRKSLIQPGSIYSDEQLKIINDSKKIKKTHDSCKENVLLIIDLIETVSTLRNNVSSSVNVDVITELKVKSEIIEKKTGLFCSKVFKALRETDENLLEGIKKLHFLLKEAVDRKTYECSKLEKDREEYERVKGPKFLELVSEYKTVKQIIRHKEGVLENFGFLDNSPTANVPSANVSSASVSFLLSDDEESPHL